MNEPTSLQARTLLRKLVLASALVGVPFMLHGQEVSKPKTLEEALTQIELLQKQMADLEKFVKTELSQKAIPAAAPGTQPAPVQPSSPTANASATPPPSGPSASPENGFVKWNELT